MAYEAIAKMNSEGLVSAKAKEDYTDQDLFKAYRKSIAKGILKVMSKMGISTLQSYKGAQVCAVLLVWLFLAPCWCFAFLCRVCFPFFSRYVLLLVLLSTKSDLGSSSAPCFSAL